MGRMRSVALAWVLIALLALAVGLSTAQGPGSPTDSPYSPIGSAFTYQGLLTREGNPLDDNCDFQFGLWDHAITGTLVAGPLELAAVPLTAGRFTALLDFGDVFDGTALWLAVAVRCPGDAGYTPLAERQPLTAAPYATYSQKAPWTGITSMPAGFADGVDNDTLYSAGPGLVLTGTVFAADPDYLQRRVSGVCAVGSTVRAVNADGTVVCQVDAPLNRPLPPMTNTVTMLDSYTTANDGTYTAVTIGADGLGLIAYSNGWGLVVAHCQDVACTAAITTTLDSAYTSGLFASLVLGADGLGLISYRGSWGGLKAAHCNNLECTNATITPVDSAGDVGWWTSTTIGADGLGLISYLDFDNGDLKLAHCSNVTCTAAITTTLDSAGGVGTDTSVALGADGLGLISYFDYTNNTLKVAHCSNVTCTAATITSLDSAGGTFTAFASNAIGADGLGLISYNSGPDLKVAHCSNVTCTGAITTTLDRCGEYCYTALTIGADGLGLIIYADKADDPHELKAAHCSNVLCTSATFIPLDRAIASFTHPALTIGVDGLGLISYYGLTNGYDSLKVAHCSSTFCVPYFRRK